jgi:shikimate dehydrogenase
MTAEIATRRYMAGLIGASIQHSSSPAMHMDEARSLGFQVSYELFDLDLVAGGSEALPEVLAAAEARGLAGVNVTYPAKQAVIPLLHELSPEARALHSVNTVLFRDGKRIGHNTDWWGFAESFRRGLPEVSMQRVVLVGAGGAGAAVGYAALQLGTRELCIYDTDHSRASALALRLKGLFADRLVTSTDVLSSAMSGVDGLIHATPTGMQKLPGIPVPAQYLHPPLWVAEIVYFPLVTELLRVARKQGCLTVDGSGMAVFQAAMAFELFFGTKPDTARMLSRFHSKLATVAA